MLDANLELAGLQMGIVMGVWAFNLLVFILNNRIIFGNEEKIYSLPYQHVINYASKPLIS